MDTLDIIAATPIFSGLPLDCLRDLALAFSPEFVPAKSLLAQTGRTVERVGLVVCGSAEMKVQDRHGDTVRFHLLGEKDFFGESIALYNCCSLYDIESLTPMRLLQLTRERFLALLREHSMLVNVFYKINLDRLKLLVKALSGGKGQAKVKADKNQPNHAIVRAMRFIDDNYHEPLTLDQVAQLSNLSKFHFLRKFKETTGLTFKEYLNLKRVEHAKIMIQSGDMNISQVCYAVGFGDLSYFDRVFRRIEGQSPSQYKKSLKSSPPAGDTNHQPRLRPETGQGLLIDDKSKFVS